MNRFTFILTLSALALGAGCLRHDLLRETPVKWDVDLVQREAEFFDELRTHLLPEGLVVYMKRPPGDLAALYRQGTVQADGAYFNGQLLAALVFKYKVTGDPEILELVKNIADGHHLLVEGSGYSGLVARSFGKTEPSSTELVYRRDGSGDGLIGWTFGTAVFSKYIDDPVRKARFAGDVKAIVEHLRRHDLKIYEDEDRPTPYGNFKTPVVGVPIGHYAVAMMGLANLAVFLNPGDSSCRDFLAYLVEEDYHRQARHFYSWFPHHADNSVAYAMNLAVAFLFDDTPHRRKFYAEGREAFWERCYDWQLALYALLYKWTGGDSKSSMIRDSIDRLRNLHPYHRRLVNEKEVTVSHSKIVPVEDRRFSSSVWTRDVRDELTTQEGERDAVAYCRVDFLLGYWLGRFLGEYNPEAGE
jgi:hypothetical protein